MGLLSVGLGSGRSSIVSAAELYAREGETLAKSMHFRGAGNRLSVFMSLERADGFHDEWRAGEKLYVFEGHDSDAEGSRGKQDDQLLTYASGKPTENGKFFKAANDFKDGMRPDPLQAQVYEKLQEGVFYDKGIFDLIDAARVVRGGRKVCQFFLRPADLAVPEEERGAGWREDWIERMMPAAEKAAAWQRDLGRCAVCGSEENLFFVTSAAGSAELHCADHS